MMVIILFVFVEMVGFDNWELKIYCIEDQGIWIERNDLSRGFDDIRNVF